MRRATIVVVLVMVALLAGCTAAPQPWPSSGPKPGTPGLVPKPGLTDLGNGRVEVYGTLANERELEGGFWAVKEAVPGQVTSETRNAALLLGTDKLSVDLTGLEGRYVHAEGKAVGGVSTRMAGPEIEVTTLTAVPYGR
jgi:hypothetical protein